MFDMQVGLSKDFKVNVKTTENKGHSIEELAERCTDKIVSVSDYAKPEVKEQAHAFKRRIKQLIELYMQQAVKSDRTTVYNAIINAGQPKLAELIRRL
jgi:gas vesicle protein